MAALAVHDECASHATIAATFAGAIMAIISCGGSGRARLPCCGEDRGRARKDGEWWDSGKDDGKAGGKEGAKGGCERRVRKVRMARRAKTRETARENKSMNDFSTNHC